MDNADSSDADRTEYDIAMRGAWSAAGRLCSFARFRPGHQKRTPYFIR